MAMQLSLCESEEILSRWRGCEMVEDEEGAMLSTRICGPIPMHTYSELQPEERTTHDS